MREQFERWARTEYHPELDLEMVNAPEGHPDFQMYRSAMVRAMFATWCGAVKTMAQKEAL